MIAQRLESPIVRVSLLTLAVAAFILIVHERQLADADPAGFALAMKYGFNVREFRPHPPGYPGFYLLWKALQYLTGLTPRNVLLLANGIFSCLTIPLTYLGASRIASKKVAWFATILVATNPLFLYFASITELYPYDAALSAFLVILVFTKPKANTYILFFLYGLLGAFRLSSIILTAPVIGFALLLQLRGEAGWRSVLMAVSACAVGTLTWLIPYSAYLGGLSAFVAVTHTATELSATLSQNLATYGTYTLWMLNLALVFIALRVRRRRFDSALLPSPYMLLLLLITIPATYFAVKYYAKGYALIYIVPLEILIAHLLDNDKEVAALASFNLLLFFAVPFVLPSARSALNHEHRTKTERATTALYRATSFYAPTFAHIRSADRDMQQVASLLARVPSGSTVYLDNSSAPVYPRSLQALRVDLHFVIAGSHGKVNLYSADILHKEVPWDSLPKSAAMFILTTHELATLLPVPGTFSNRSGVFKLYSLGSNELNGLRAYSDTYFASEGE